MSGDGSGTPSARPDTSANPFLQSSLQTKSAAAPTLPAHSKTCTYQRLWGVGPNLQIHQQNLQAFNTANAALQHVKGNTALPTVMIKRYLA